MNQRTHATDGTQAHTDLATKKNNISYWMKVHGMSRDEAKVKVEHPSYKMMDSQTINREIATEARRQANLQARAEREAKVKTEAEEKAKKEAEEKAKKEAEPKPKTESKLKRQGGMKVTINNIEYSNLTAAMVSTGKYDLTDTKERAKAWNKIRKVIQAGNECIYDGDSYKMI
jgi:membrane protein involved in colicin uptake